MGKFSYHFPVWPAVFVEAFQFVIAGKTQYFAYTDMHEILLFLFGENFSAVSQFLNANEEKDAVEVLWLFSNYGFQCEQKGVPVFFEIKIAFKHAVAPPKTQMHAADEE